MRVLVIHNRYSGRVPSGENVSVDSEVGWLRQAGVDVHVHEATNDDLLQGGIAHKIRTGTQTVWSRPARRTFMDALARSEPDLVHIHNLFPLMSASVPWAAHRRGIPVVWTVRNRRVTCITGGHFRNDAPCHACHPGYRLPGIRHGCYNDSVAASALMTGATSIFRSVARRHITPVAISHSMKQWLVEAAGFPAPRVHVKYNGVTPPAPEHPLPCPTQCHTLLYVGKFAEHKGVGLLLDAWRRLPELDMKLRFVGDGPLAALVKAAVAADDRVSWVGTVDHAELPVHLGQSRAVVVPSTWQEPFGRSAAEALAYGRPVVTTGLGGLDEIVDDSSGWITGTDPAELALALSATASDSAIAARSEAARERHRRLFSPRATTDALLEVYEKARFRPA